MTNKNLTLWDSTQKDVLPTGINLPQKIAEYAKQLSIRERRQLSQSFQAEHYEVAVNYVWNKSMAALKKELATLGIKFLGEMLNKPDLREDDDVFDVVTDKEAIRLAEELGMVTSTEAMRLRQSHELATHFSQLEAEEIDEQNIEMQPEEAIGVLKTCVRNILGKPNIEVATRFIEFRDALLSETLKPNDHRVSDLIASPYFFHKLTVSILLANIKKSIGAKLQHALSNFNLLIPGLWERLRDTEKWQIGHTYSEVYAAGQSIATSGLKMALLKVKGFDFVPETLRSDTFIKAAENVIKAHEGMNNFFNEEAPMKVLVKLGSTIPSPAFSICASAILAVRLGNSYGYSWSTAPLTNELLDNITPDRWEYYLNQCLPGDTRILEKLLSEKPQQNWFQLVEKYEFSTLNIKNKEVALLINNSTSKNKSKVSSYSLTLIESYYGKKHK